MTANQVREDLKNIRYYYSRKVIFDSEMEQTGKNRVCELIEKYDKIMCTAKPRLYDLYVCLYKNSSSQVELSMEMGYTIEYMSRLNSQLVKFICDKLNEQGE